VSRDDIPVPNFGVHTSEGVSFLHQGSAATNFVGLKRKSPFVVMQSSGMRFCNHRFPVAAPIPDRTHWDAFLPLLEDPLVKAMLPVPHEAGDRSVYVVDPSDELRLYLVALSTMSSPINKAVLPLWMMDARRFRSEMAHTNVQPLVLTQATTTHQKAINELVELSAYQPRTLIITGAKDVVVPAPMKRITTKILHFPLEDLIQLPLGTLGMALLRRWARREALDAPMEGRDERRDRLIKERTSGDPPGRF
jgi:hypothetical protein